MISSFSGFSIEAGCDEAGRGCLAGPVVAAAVILPPGPPPALIADSKKLSESSRNSAAKWIKEYALSWSVSIISPTEIDRLNILNASILAMNNAAENLEPLPEYILIDGNRFHSSLGIPYSCIVKGDSKIACIAAASIIAKTTRDKIMLELHEEFPYYNWKKNKGYPTVDHRKAILEWGVSSWHRKTFKVTDPDQKLIQFN